MSIGHYRKLCHRYRGRAVEIRTRDGKVHRGIISHVDNHKVYIHPLSRRRDFGGYGSGFFGPGFFGRRRSFALGVALGAITTLVLLPFFFF